MMIAHHPSEAAILDYVSGALDEAWSLAVATHLALCPECRRLAESYEAVGGEFMAAEAPSEISMDGLEAVMDRLNGVDAETQPGETQVSGASTPVLPEPLRSYVGGDVDAVDWRPLGGGAAQCILPLENSTATARLLRIPASQPVPEHTHRGLEMTLVLDGAFTDDTGRYGRGDLQEADESLQHIPHAAAGADCICLAVTDAPLKFAGVLPRIMQRFLRI